MRFLLTLLVAIAAPAIVACASFAQSAAETAATLIDQAGEHHERREWQAAIDDATEALKLDPNAALAYTIRGDAKTQIKDYKGAIADLTEALRLDPKQKYAYINRGAAYDENGETDLALADFDAAIRLEPDWGVAYRVKAELLLGKRRYSDAIPSLTKAIELIPERVYLLRDRAEAYAAIGDFEHAFADYDEGLRRSPKDARFLHGRGVLHQKRGEMDAALADLTAAVEIAPAAKDIWLARAQVYRAMGNTAAAQSDEDRARNVPKNWPDAPEFILLVAIGLMLNPITALPGIAGALMFKNWMKSLAAAVALSLVIHLLMSGDPFEDWGMLAFGAMNLAVTLIWWAIIRWIASRWRRRRTTEPPAVPSS